MGKFAYYDEAPKSSLSLRYFATQKYSHYELNKSRVRPVQAFFLENVSEQYLGGFRARYHS